MKEEPPSIYGGECQDRHVRMLESLKQFKNLSIPRSCCTTVARKNGHLLSIIFHMFLRAQVFSSSALRIRVKIS